MSTAMTADLFDQLQSSLGDTYTLDLELGGGGMSRVFAATETALGRSVVVKVLPPELAPSVSSDRFKREIAVAARLQHPHIVPLLAAGQTSGVPYFTMPHIEGESLRVRLARCGEMPVSEAVRILREIASALAYAHEQGVVHRDIKPDNVLFAGDVAMVADFGVAKAIVAAAGDDQRNRKDLATAMTSLGVALGTPAYMSPEQATADPTTDHRADIYAFGVLAYEMLTGQPPFSGRSPSQLLSAHVTETPEPISRRRPNLPPALAALVMRCLEKRPSDRPQRVSEIVHALDDITTPSGGMAPASAVLRPMPRFARAKVVLIGVFTLGLLAAVGAVWKQVGATGEAPSAHPSAPRIAVLPFENLGNSSDAYFADGITDAVRGKLTSLANLEVIARGSSVQYRGSTKTLTDIARELGVRYLLTGTVRWAKDPGGKSRVQVSPELIEVASAGAASSRWQQPFDAELADVFRVQGEIAGKVAEAMSVAVGGADQARIIDVPTRNPAAYDAFLRGEALYLAAGRSPAPLRLSVAEYERAVGLDSGYAVAWAALSRAQSILYANGVPTPELSRSAREAAERALRIAPNDPLAHNALGIYFGLVEENPKRALPELEKARAASPNDAEIAGTLAIVYTQMGRFEDAMTYARAAQRLNPRSWLAARQMRLILTRLRRYPEAREAADREIALVPNAASFRDRVLVSLADGDLLDARRIADDAGRRMNRDEFLAYMAVYDDLGWALDDAAQRRALVLGPEMFDNDRANWAIVRAQIYGWRGDSALARAWGDSAAREFAVQLRVVPNDAQRHTLRGLALAYAGRRAEALAEGERGVELMPVERHFDTGSYNLHQLVRIHLLVGDRKKALDLLEWLLAQPYTLSPGWLRIDPTFAPLRGNPRFEKLSAGT